jgi:hypothetical protein
MTYRIDIVSQSINPGYSWSFEIKGFEGRGEYATLYADQEGRSLYRVESISIEMIPGTEAFEVPKDATKAEAHHALAMFLDRLGWGPMVDQAGNIVDPSKADPNEPVRW